MKITCTIKIAAFAFTICVFTMACTPDARNEAESETAEVESDMGTATDETTQEANEAMGEADNEFNDFSAWVSENSTKAKTATKAEWEEMKAENKRRETDLEARSNTWDEETTQAWRELKDSWKRTENKVQALLQ